MTKLAREATRRVGKRADEARSQVQETAPEPLADAADSARERVGALAGRPTLTGELKETSRDGAIEVLRPVLRKATTTAAMYAVTQGPSLVKDRVAPKVKDAGGAGAIAKAAAAKGRGLGGVVSKLTGARKAGKSP